MEEKDLLQKKHPDAEKMESSDGCLKCAGNKRVIVIIIVATVVILIAVAVSLAYTEHRQQQQQDINQSILQKIEKLEQELSACTCKSTDVEEDTSILAFHEGMELRLDSRKKREAQHTITSPPTEDQLNETKHIRNEHHGIASSHIALLYADPVALVNETGLAQGGRSTVRFRNSTYTENFCSKVLENRRGDLWCVPKKVIPQPPHTISLNMHSKYYPYFVKAQWMNGQRASENFQVTGDDAQKLIVNQPGIYIVTSSAHFRRVTTGRIHYGVFARNSKDDASSERPLGRCASSTGEGGISSNYPCSTWQLAPLNKGDRVFMRINPFEWIVIQKETFYLALIKLNDHTFNSATSGDAS